METAKFYVIDGVVVTNIIVCTEEYAAKNNLIRHPFETQFGQADINWTYIDGNFLPPPRDILAEWAYVRDRRNSLLAQSDAWVIQDRFATLTVDQQQEVLKYRAILRDIPQTFVDPKEVKYPERPSFL